MCFYRQNGNSFSVEILHVEQVPNLWHSGGGFCNFARGETMVFQGYQKSNCIRGRKRDLIWAIDSRMQGKEGRKPTIPQSPKHENVPFKNGKRYFWKFWSQHISLFWHFLCFFSLGNMNILFEKKVGIQSECDTHPIWAECPTENKKKPETSFSFREALPFQDLIQLDCQAIFLESSPVGIREKSNLPNIKWNLQYAN